MKKNERKNMNNKFDQLTKQMAQSVTRRGALKTFGVGLAGMALACFGLANKLEAGFVTGSPCQTDSQCNSGICSGGYCACLPTGSPCRTSNQCCTGWCVVGHCQHKWV